MTNIVDAVLGVEAACMVKPLVHRSDFSGLTYMEITSMYDYKDLIENPDAWRPSNPVNKIITW